jgi:TonB-linked SusC/RagA family outer membrane protein
MKKVVLFFSILLFMGILTANSQTRVLTGKVTSSEDNLPIPGVSISVEGTTLGTVTDMNGNYTLQVPEDARILIFSFVGMATQEISIEGRSSVNVEMQPATIGLEEVVVTALGIQRSEKSLGYSTQSVGGEQLSEAPELNLVNSLSGRVAGVHITNSSGAVGSSSRMILRGATSIYGDLDPLFVIDGVPIANANYGTSTGYGGFDMPNGVADIDPSIIESVNILKGPSAAALYGLRAANGVVVITTKKGARGRALGVEVSQSVTFENPLILPDYQNSYGQGPSKHYFEYVNGTSADGGVDESWGPPLDVGLKFMQFSSFINNPDNPQPEPWISHPDNVKNFFETGLTSRTNVSVSGGSDVTTFRLDAGYSGQDGMIPFTDFRRINLNGSGSHKITEKFQVNFGMKFIKSDSDNLPNSGYDGSNVVQQTIWSGRQVDFEALKDWKNIPKALPGSVFGEGDLPLNWNTQFQNNPYWQMETNRNKFNRNRYIGNLGFKYDIADWLNLTGNAGLDNYVTKTSVSLAKGSSNDAPTYWRFGSAFNRDSSEGFYDEEENNRMEVNADLMFNINKSISDHFAFMGSIGGSMMHRQSTYDYRAIQLELPDLYNLGNMKAGTSLVNRNEHYQRSINSLFGSAEFSFREYLFLTFTGRNDWASVLPLNNNSFFYPSITVSAVLSDMLPIKSNTLNFLKVRGGWAQVGSNGPLDPGEIHPVYELSSAPWSGNTFAEFPNTLNNANIKSQTTTGYEGGLELRMFSNRLRFDFTYYDQTSVDLVLPVQVSTSSGVGYVWDNVGELNNKGVEVQLSGTLIETANKDFALDFGINFAKNNNMVLKAGKDNENDEETLLIGNLWNMNLEAREGYAYGAIVGTALSRTESGEVIYTNGLPDLGETEVLGGIQPDWTGGLSLGITYKGLNLGGLIDTKMGGNIYSMTTAWGRYAGVLAETLEGRETGIVGDGVMLKDDVYVPNDVVVSAEVFNHGAYGDQIVETSVFDASYVKLRELTLSYNLPRSVVSQIGLENVNFGVIGRNLAILYKRAPHIDPESAFDSSNEMQGMEFGQLPSARSIGLSVNVKF